MQKKLVWSTLLFAVATSLLIGGLFNNKTTNASGLLIADGGFGGVLEIKSQDVRVTINNGIAVTEINQVFLNTENRIVEALYTFPVPKGASVSNFSMIINGKEMIGEVVEKKRAREIYESYKSTRRDPGLLEQVDYKSFEMRVFPIAAGAEQHIKVTYYQQLDFDHDWATYVYPLATTTRRDIDQRTTGKFALTLDVKSEIPIVEMASSSHKDAFVIANHTENYSRASLETTGGDLSRDLVISFRTERPRTGIDVITSRQSGDDGFYMLTMTAGKELEDFGGGMDYVFVVDISGSMANDGKLRLSRNAAQAFMESLGDKDRFEVMTFNISPETLFGGMQEVGEEVKQQASEFLGSQRARGGTSLRPAMMTAYKYKDADRPLNVVVLSDGMTEQREQQELLSLIQNAPTGSRVFCVGIGNSVNRPLLKQLAEEAGGLAAFISHGDDFQRQAKAFRRKLVRPVAENLVISIDGVENFEFLPEKLPNLYHGSPLRMIGRYRKPGVAKIRVAGDVMGQPFEKEMEVEFPDTNNNNPQIERIWAWHQVEKLQNQMRRTGKSQRTIDAIVGLCENFSIVSEYASFIVLENDAEYRRWKIERRNASRIDRDRQARESLRQALDKLREKSLSQITPANSTNQKVVSDEQPESPSGDRLASRRQPTDPVITTPRNTSRDIDFTVPSLPGPGGGGGCIDPITGLIGAGLAGASALAARRRKRKLGQVDSDESERQV